MKVLIIGSGGREHALAWKISQSNKVSKLYCAPGNAGTKEIAENVNIKVDNLNELLEFVKKENIDFTVVGPEVPLSLGIVDLFISNGLKIFGPKKDAAFLEGSKSFAKEVMIAAGVPTAGHKTFTTRNEVESYIKEKGLPQVLKADGLAAGKGVFVCLKESEVEPALNSIFNDIKAEEVVVEEWLDGVEASLIIATDGKRIVPMATSHDYKREGDGDTGNNTGGMGSVSPTPRLTPEQELWAIDNVIRPMLIEMEKRNKPFMGFLYAGLMISSKKEIKVLEFNVRFGDPETQSILRRLDSDLFEILYGLTTGEEIPEAKWSKNIAVCVVVSGGNYPSGSSKGEVIQGIEKADAIDGIKVFHAGTTNNEQGAVVTNGGRILSVTASCESIEEAKQAAYNACKEISFPTARYRHDIGQ